MNPDTGLYSFILSNISAFFWPNIILLEVMFLLDSTQNIVKIKLAQTEIGLRENSNDNFLFFCTWI